MGESKEAEARGVIYFVRAQGIDLIKIGFSTNLNQRLRVLQASSPVRLSLLKYVKGSLQTEQALLSVFAKFREHGEWFRAEPPLTRFIEKLVSKQKFSPEMLVQK